MSLSSCFGRWRLLQGRSLTMGMRVTRGRKVSFPSSVAPRDCYKWKVTLVHATRRSLVLWFGLGV
jgi:hypothetical protein